VITYEFPLNERVRTMLRLEDLYSRVDHFIERDTSDDHHAAIQILFDLVEVASRADLKADLLQELDRQKRMLMSLHDNPDVSEEALGTVLEKIEKCSDALSAIAGKVGQPLRDNEWLMSIKQRASIPGGTCEFDLPSYHYWQRQDAAIRRKFLTEWMAPLEPIRRALSIVLRLLRDGGKPHQLVAQHGNFQQMQGGRMAQMLRVVLNDTLPCIPEVSANKYALSIRFIQADYAAKSTLYDHDVEFELIFCSLS
jgi:cell division protein ZapD